MLRRSRALLALAVLLAASGCGKDRRTELVTLQSTLESRNAVFAEAFAKRDVQTLGQCYTTDAQAFPPGVAPVSGRAAIQDMWKGFLAMPVGRIELRTQDVNGSEETAWEAGSYTLVGTNGATMDEGKYIVVWKHEADGWKMYRDMWSSNSPQPTSAAPSP
jgi:ketosteroid isomerase-like protein